VICELLGVPPEDRDGFAAWSTVVVANATPAALMEAIGTLQAYLSGLIEAKRTQPDDALISALIRDTDEDKLSHAELVAMAVMLLIAGHGTTSTSLPGCSARQDRGAGSDPRPDHGASRHGPRGGSRRPAYRHSRVVRGLRELPVTLDA
jgi:hypothetical protein